MQNESGSGNLNHFFAASARGTAVDAGKSALYQLP